MQWRIDDGHQDTAVRGCNLAGRRNVYGLLPELDLATCGHTIEEVRHNLHEVIKIFLQETADMGTLGELLAEAGYSRDGAVSGFPRL